MTTKLNESSATYKHELISIACAYDNKNQKLITHKKISKSTYDYNKSIIHKIYDIAYNREITFSDLVHFKLCLETLTTLFNVKSDGIL